MVGVQRRGGRVGACSAGIGLRSVPHARPLTAAHNAGAGTGPARQRRGPCATTASARAHVCASAPRCARQARAKGTPAPKVRARLPRSRWDRGGTYRTYESQMTHLPSHFSHRRPMAMPGCLRHMIRSGWCFAIALLSHPAHGFRVFFWTKKTKKIPGGGHGKPFYVCLRLGAPDPH